MRNKHGDFIWYELLTTNADAAQAFYAAVLGWSYRDSGSPEMDYRLQSAKDSETGAMHEVGGTMPITPDMLAGGARPVWLGYIGVDDVDASLAKLVADGAAVMLPAFDIPGVGRLAMLKDPQGAPFYIMRGEPDETSLAFASDKPRPGHCAWNELSTTDPAAAMAFYTTHFGWTKDGEMDMGEMGAYEFLRHGSVIGALMRKPAEMPVSMWMFYFRVPDIDAATATVKASGGQVLMGPHEVPGGDWIITGLDPQGAVFALVGQRG